MISNYKRAGKTIFMVEDCFERYPYLNNITFLKDNGVINPQGDKIGQTIERLKELKDW